MASFWVSMLNFSGGIDFYIFFDDTQNLDDHEIILIMRITQMIIQTINDQMSSNILPTFQALLPSDKLT